MNDFEWLHFSDLHLNSDDPNSKRARDKLIKFIKNERAAGRLSFKYVFITGDIANKGKYDKVCDYLKSLFEALGLQCNEEGLRNVFWAVGNHDILRDETSERYKLIQQIRENPQSISLNDCLKGEKKHILVGSGMSLYKDFYKEILRRELEANESRPHYFIPLDDLNLIVLNTCLTSVDPFDTQNLFIDSDQLLDVFNEIKDEMKPIFVIGHHGRDFFRMDELGKLSDLFDDKGVDIYLCGHNHRLGFAMFPDTERDIYQLTCGGGPNFSIDSNLSFMHGYFKETPRNTITKKKKGAMRKRRG